MKPSWLDQLSAALSGSMPPGSNVARELADLLKVSPEGAYRRLRGQTAFLMEELILIRETYGISLDALAQTQPSIQVRMHPLFTADLKLEDYLAGLLKDVQYQISQHNAHIFCLAADIPFFRLLGHQYLRLFKITYWQKSILGLEKFRDQVVHMDLIAPEVHECCEAISRAYMITPSVEIWNEQTINGTLKQIEYYADCAYFSSQQLLANTYADVYNLINEVSAQAVSGSKNHGEIEDETYSLWNCELVIDNNSVLIESDQMARLGIGFNSFNTLQSTQKQIVDEYKAWLDAMISKSTSLSGQSDKHRVQFIQSLHNSVRSSARSKLDNQGLRMFEELIQTGQSV